MIYVYVFDRHCSETPTLSPSSEEDALPAGRQALLILGALAPRPYLRHDSRQEVVYGRDPAAAVVRSLSGDDAMIAVDEGRSLRLEDGMQEMRR